MNFDQWSATYDWANCKNQNDAAEDAWRACELFYTEDVGIDEKTEERPLYRGWEADQCSECKDILGHKSTCSRQYDDDEEF